MKSPQFYQNIKFQAPSSQRQNSQFTYDSNMKQKQQPIQINNQTNNENKDPNFNQLNQTIFHQYQKIIEALSSSQYSINIMNSNINHLDKQYQKKNQLYLTKLKQIDKLKKLNLKTKEAIQAQNHRTKQLKKSNKINIKQLQEINNKLNTTFQQRLKSQQQKNQLYEQYKQLQEEYTQKIEDLQSFFSNKALSIHINSTETPKVQNQSLNTTFNNLPPKQALQALKIQNNKQLPQLLEQKKQQIFQLQSQLQSRLQKRQLVKQNIKYITQSIKSFEEQQFELQVNIEKLQKQKSILSKSQLKVQQKSDYLNNLFDQVQYIKIQLDQKCQQKYDLVNYLKEVQKQEKNMRKIRKIQVQCEQQQQIYKKQKQQQFTVLESQQDQPLQQFRSKQSRKSSQNQQRPYINNKSQPLQKVQRFDTQTTQKFINLIQRYENVKIKKKN